VKTIWERAMELTAIPCGMDVPVSKRRMARQHPEAGLNVVAEDAVIATSGSAEKSGGPSGTGGLLSSERKKRTFFSTATSLEMLQLIENSDMELWRRHKHGTNTHDRGEDWEIIAG